MSIRLVVVALLATLSIGAAAHDIFDFDDWMQRIEDGSLDLQRHIAARNSGGAVAAARELEELYGLMEEFFRNREGSAEAVRYSREGRDFAQRALLELDAGHFTAARRSALSIAHGCRDCHFNYKPL